MAKKNQKLVLQKVNSDEPLNGVFEKSSSLQDEGFVVKSLAPLIKPLNFPDNAVLRGVFEKIVPLKKFGKGKLARWGYGIQIKPDNNPPVVLTATGCITNALDFNTDKVNQETGEGVTSTAIGKEVAIQKLAGKLPSKKGQDAWNFVVGIKD